MFENLTPGLSLSLGNVSSHRCEGVGTHGATEARPQVKSSCNEVSFYLPLIQKYPSGSHVQNKDDVAPKSQKRAKI